MKTEEVKVFNFQESNIGEEVNLEIVETFAVKKVFGGQKCLTTGNVS